MKRRAILLDAFGIAAECDIRKSELGFAELFGVSHERACAILNAAGRKQFAFGRFGLDEFHRRLNEALVRGRTGIAPISASQLICRWTATYAPRSVVKNMLLAYKDQLPPIFLCSNANEVDVDWLTAQGVTSWHGVAGLITSLETGGPKESPAFLHAACRHVSKHLGEEVAMGDIHLIDANFGIIGTASGLGMQTSLFSDIPNLRRALSGVAILA